MNISAGAIADSYMSTVHDLECILEINVMLPHTCMHSGSVLYYIIQQAGMQLSLSMQAGVASHLGAS